jgi:hypothetical protein
VGNLDRGERRQAFRRLEHARWRSGGRLERQELADGLPTGQIQRSLDRGDTRQRTSADVGDTEGERVEGPV